MQLKQLQNQWRVIMSSHDYQTLIDHAPDFKTELAIRLGGECGLRVSEIARVKPKHIKASTDPGIDAYFLRVYGKDTTGNFDNGKYREAYLPRDVESLFTRYTRSEGITSDEDVFPVTKRSVQNWIKDTAEAVADSDEKLDDFRKLSAHDLRAYFATRCLVEKGMNPRVVMNIGGWEDYESIKPYLGEATESAIVDEFEGADMR